MKNNMVKLIDYLYKHDMYYATCTTEDEKTELNAFIKTINDVLAEYNVSDLECNIFHHYVSCALEIGIPYSKDNNNFDNYALGYLLHSAKNRLNKNIYELLESFILNFSSNDMKQRRNYFCYKYFFYHYPGAAEQLYLYSIQKEILFSKKVSKDEEDRTSFVIRLGLLLEFEIFRYKHVEFCSLTSEYTYENFNQLYIESQQNYEQILDKHGKFKATITFLKSIDIMTKAFLEYFNLIDSDIKFNINAQDFCIEMINMSINLLGKIEYKNCFIYKGTDILKSLGILELIKEQQLNRKLAIYDEYENNLSCHSSQSLSRKGIKLSAKTIYLKYKEQSTKEFIQTIDMYKRIISHMNHDKYIWHGPYNLANFSLELIIT